MESMEGGPVFEASRLDPARSDRGDEPEDTKAADAIAKETNSGKGVFGTGEGRMLLLQKLLLNAQMIGSEANTNIGQLYTVPNLQLLGMPLKLVSLSAVVAGPAGALLTPLLGWISDRGSNPNRRKMLNVMFCSALLVSGVLCIIMANVLHLQSHSITAKDAKMKPDMMPNTENFTTWLPIANASDERCGMHLNVNETGTPLKAWLGMVGYIIIDVAFQFSIAFGKSWVVLCSPRPEHTSVLMLGTVMSSAGGLLTSVITTIDLQDICFCCSAKGMDLVVEVILQECIVFVLVLVGSVLTVVVGQRHLRRLINQKGDWSGVGKTSENTEPDAKGDPIAAADETDKERTPLIRDAEEPDQSASQISRAYLRNYRTNTPASSNLTASSNDCMDSGNRTSPQVTICVRASPNNHRGNNFNFKRQLFLIFLSVYFSSSVVQIFCMLSTDYVGKAIYGGNPEAEPGSDSLRNYQTGVKFASVGFIVYYSSYLLASVCQKRVHQLLGYRGEYTLIFLSVSVSMVTLALIPRIEIYFVMCILTGFQRASYYVVTFAATNDIVQAQAIRSGQDGAAQLGLFMSLVSGMDPLSFATIYPSILALEQSTGLVSFPLWTAAVSGCVSIVCFLLVGNI